MSSLDAKDSDYINWPSLNRKPHSHGQLNPASITSVG